MVRLARAIAGAPFAAVIFTVLALACSLPTAAQRFDRGLLWRIEGGGVPAAHVFGTIHVADPRVTKLPPEVSRALSDARSLTVELGLAPANLAALANRMVFLDGRDLPGAVGPELYRKTAELTGKLGIPEPALRLFRPWAIALLLSVPQQRPGEVLDFALAAAARAEGKPVHELESVEEQVAVFESLRESDQVAMLRRAVGEYPQMPRVINRLIEAWLARDLAALWRIGEELAAADPELKRLNQIIMPRLLQERNARMAERVQARLKEGGAFVAVGALHLYGDAGVLAELERRGWRVTRVY